MSVTQQNEQKNEQTKPALPTDLVLPEKINTISEVQIGIKLLQKRLNSAVIGRSEVVDWVIVALLADGHLLLEDYPGSGKTTLAKALGNSLCDQSSDQWASFRRIQFTPDLLPGDVTGSMIFDLNRNQFDFRPGPLFAHIVLADEINRTSPKVQSALLEAMGEKQVTVDNQTHQLDDLFFVMATQNPLDLAGTYPLPVAQLDRFLFKIRMDHIAREDELKVVQTWDQDRITPNLAKISRDQLIQMRKIIREEVSIADEIKTSLVDAITDLRTDASVLQGGSTRSMVLAMPALKALAALSGRTYVSSIDLERLIYPLINHRLEFNEEPEDLKQFVSEKIKPSIQKLAKKVFAPKSK